MLSRAATLALALLAAVPAGCGASAPATPEAQVWAFAAAIREDRHRDAYAMMSRSYRRRVPFAEFERLLSDNPEEARELAGLLTHLDGEPEVGAIVRYAEDEELRLVREEDGWRIVGDAVDFYDQSTPRAAIRTFVRAMERGRYDVVMRLVPEADRVGMTEEQMQAAFEGEGRLDIERMLATLRESLDNPIEQVGDRATMPYGEGATVQLVREGGEWRVEDPD